MSCLFVTGGESIERQQRTRRLCEVLPGALSTVRDSVTETDFQAEVGDKIILHQRAASDGTIALRFGFGNSWRWPLNVRSRFQRFRSGR